VEEAEDELREGEDFGDEADEAATEEDFDLERGRRSLASIFDSDEESVVEVDAAQADESLKARRPCRALCAAAPACRGGGRACTRARCGGGAANACTLGRLPDLHFGPPGPPVALACAPAARAAGRRAPCDGRRRPAPRAQLSNCGLSDVTVKALVQGLPYPNPNHARSWPTAGCRT
jgi:hypothetical protein